MPQLEGKRSLKENNSSSPSDNRAHSPGRGNPSKVTNHAASAGGKEGNPPQRRSGGDRTWLTLGFTGGLQAMLGSDVVIRRSFVKKTKAGRGKKEKPPFLSGSLSLSNKV